LEWIGDEGGEEMDEGVEWRTMSRLFEIKFVFEKVKEGFPEGFSLEGS
jgi:hypothetical protein